MKEFIHPVRVYIEDTDAGGIVYYVNYLKYMERSRTELLRSLGHGKTAILDDGLLLVIRSAEVDYLLPARLDDELEVSTCLKELANSYLVFHQEVRRGSQLLCFASVKLACVVERDGVMKPTGFPKYIKAALQNYYG